MTLERLSRERISCCSRAAMRIRSAANGAAIVMAVAVLTLAHVAAHLQPSHVKGITM